MQGFGNDVRFPPKRTSRTPGSLDKLAAVRQDPLPFDRSHACP
jgi:hypothetical protein